ncbi:MAG: efflux transporter outer membrane subunit [Hoeflea sp.]|uniref:efflux transporter outer membrane subunit n=1 Tax=Hoeflea sp. TaxID=1940281 RepID=UPI00272EEAE9|nr:efflux transporter outer membrane subunit [Hoeflea sp.]MDP2121847.1 efflux transporter outer membrane subunit [Hoeflea sp.]
MIPFPRTSILTASLLSLCACASVGPDYKGLDAATPASYVDGGTASAGDVSLVKWWQGLGAPQLDALVERGLAQNLSIQTAIERVEEARAGLRSTGAGTVSGNLSGASVRSGGSASPTVTTSSAVFNASLVLDLFGGQRRAVERARAQAESADYDIGTARLAFLASLTGAYVDARYFQETLELTRQTIATRERTFELVRAQEDAGTATELDRVQARALLEEARASLPALESGFDSAVYAIATLLAEPAGPLRAALQKGAAQPRPKAGLAAGVPADLLRNRPDIRAAERELAAAVAAIGVAEAQLYPSITLSGDITASSANSWSFGPTLVLPVLSQPKLRADRDQAISRARQAELAWRARILAAVEETQSALGTAQRTQRALVSQRAAAQSYARAVELSQLTYSGGTTTLLTLLDAERSRAAARLSLAQSVQSLATTWISLQVATGQGWATQ